MRARLLLAAMLLFAAGCTTSYDNADNKAKQPVTAQSENKQPVSIESVNNQDQPVQITEKQQVQELPFQNGRGRAVIVFDESGADFVVMANGLDSNKKYSITIEGDKTGVTFGPEVNVKRRVGSLVNETEFKPNSEGELFVSMLNPIRLLQGNMKLTIREADKDNKIILSTHSFAVDKQD